MLIFNCAGTGPSAEYLVSYYMDQRPATIAVLPMENETTDLDAPEMIRELMSDELTKNGYETLDVDTITTILRAEGITEGGQLGAISTGELHNILPADAALYGNITTFRHFITGIYNERTVTTEFRLIDLESGEKLWEDEERVSKRQLATDSEAIKDALLQNVTSRVIEKWAQVPLLPESREIVATHLATLPWGPNKEGYPTWLWSNPNMKIGASILYGYPHVVGLQVAAWQHNLGFQGNLGIFSKSVNLIYSPRYNKIGRY